MNYFYSMIDVPWKFLRTIPRYVVHAGNSSRPNPTPPWFDSYITKCIQVCYITPFYKISSFLIPLLLILSSMAKHPHTTTWIIIVKSISQALQVSTMIFVNLCYFDFLLFTYDGGSSLHIIVKGGGSFLHDCMISWGIRLNQVSWSFRVRKLCIYSAVFFCDSWSLWVCP